MNSVTPASGDNREGSRNARSTRWRRLRLIFKVVEIRLRFIAILVLVALFVGYWDTITNHWEKQTRSDGAVYNAVRTTLGKQAVHWLWPQAEVVSNPSNTEYFCPMHPNVVRQTLEPDGSVPKCPICGMPLSLRKKGGSSEAAERGAESQAVFARANPVGGDQHGRDRLPPAHKGNHHGGVCHVRRKQAVADRRASERLS